MSAHGAATRLAYGVGSVAEGVKETAFNTFLLFYYNQVLGLPGSLGGVAILVALCIDAVTDPLVGSVSDGFRHRLGRRHPFLYASVLPLALSFWLLFHPPGGLGPWALFAWLTVFASLVRTSITLYSIPSNALVAELTDDYDERTALVGWRHLFGWAGGLAFLQVGYRVFFRAREGMPDGRLDAAAYGGFALVGATAMAVAILACALGTHRLIPTLATPRDAAGFTLDGFARQIRDALASRSYRVLVISSLFSSVAAGFSNVVGLYMGTYFWELRSDELAAMALSLAVSVVVAIALAGPLAAAFEKHRVARWLAGIGIVFAPLPIFLRLAGAMPPNGHPALLPILLAHGAMLATGVILIGILIGSMIADTVDESELATGRRQEGVFASAISFAWKATSGAGGFLAGLTLEAIAFPTQAPPGGVPAEKLVALGVAVGPLMMALNLLSLVFLSRYRLTRARHAEVLAELAKRRGVSGVRRPPDRRATAA